MFLKFLVILPWIKWNNSISSEINNWKTTQKTQDQQCQQCQQNSRHNTQHHPPTRNPPATIASGYSAIIANAPEAAVLVRSSYFAEEKHGQNKMDMLSVFLRNSMSLRTFPNLIYFMSKRTEVHLDHFGRIPFQIRQKSYGGFAPKVATFFWKLVFFLEKINENKKFTIAILFGSASFQ